MDHVTLGKKALETCKIGEAVHRLASLGFHVDHPYHNLDHELMVLGAATACAIHENEEDPLSFALVAACMMHDHNHSGGLTTDDFNILRAVDFVRSAAFRQVVIDPIKDLKRLQDSFINDVVSLIECTEYSRGTFKIETPTTLAERCIRDADLFAIYQDNAAEWVYNLYVEMGQANPDARIGLDKFFVRNCEFLRNAPMYTKYGSWLKQARLERQLRKVEQDFATLGEPSW